jgi:HSP20 family protein
MEVRIAQYWSDDHLIVRKPLGQSSAKLRIPAHIQPARTKRFARCLFGIGSGTGRASETQEVHPAMSTITVQKISEPGGKPLPIFEDMEKLCQRVRDRAYTFFLERGSQMGRALDDWLKAEREAFGWPAAEMKETEESYELELTLPGFDAKEVQVTATPTQILVHAVCPESRRPAGAKVVWSEFGANDVYRRFEMPQPVDVERVSARLDKGLLRIKADKAAVSPAKPIAVAAA